VATKLYFRNSDAPYTGPDGEQSTATDSNAGLGGFGVAKLMTPTPGLLQQALGITTQSGNGVFYYFMRSIFMSQPLDGAQTVGGGSMTVNVAHSQTNTLANFQAGGYNVYVWRPSTSTVVGYVIDGGTARNGSSPTAANSIQALHQSGISTSAISAADGDHVVCEIWGSHSRSGMPASYGGTFYFDGTTENTTTGTVVTSHASFLELNETLAFQSPATGGARSFAVII
jgi:hypothetical protein